MKHIFKQAIANVESSFPSVYTKADVIKLIGTLMETVELEADSTPTITTEDLDEAIRDIQNEARRKVSRLNIQEYLTLELTMNNELRIVVDKDLLVAHIDGCYEDSAEEYLNGDSGKF